METSIVEFLKPFWLCNLALTRIYLRLPERFDLNVCLEDKAKCLNLINNGNIIVLMQPK